MNNKWVECQGYVMRSVTESRIANMLTALGISWLYEYTPSGHKGYLPDFYLPVLKAYVEVKGKAPTKDEKQKCERLSIETQCPVFLLYGDPSVFRQREDGVSRLEASWLPIVCIGASWHRLNVNRIVRHVYRQYGEVAGIAAAQGFSAQGASSCQPVKASVMQFMDDLYRKAGNYADEIYRHNAPMNQEKLQTKMPRHEYEYEVAKIISLRLAMMGFKNESAPREA